MDKIAILTNTLFLLSLKNINKLKVYFNNNNNKLIYKNDIIIKIIRK